MMRRGRYLHNILFYEPIELFLKDGYKLVLWGVLDCKIKGSKRVVFKNWKNAYCKLLI
jgi:hypothetical protein